MLTRIDDFSCFAVRMERVAHRYGSGPASVLALDGIDLAIARGEFVAVWGPSGSGKSTLCNLAGGIDVATSGRLLIGGRDVAGLSDDELAAHRNRRVGFIFQQFNLIGVLTALENVMLPLLLGGAARRPAARRALELLEELDIAGLAAKRPDKLSGGQRQRVATARALIHDPELVVADEPTANLDTANAARLMDMMRSLNRSRGVTFLFSTHDQRLLDRVARRIELRDGRIVHDSGDAP